MRLAVRNGKDFYSGLLFSGLAAFFGGVGLRYKAGTAMEMGPGYFPAMICIALAAVGVALVVRGLSVRETDADPDEPAFAWRPLAFICGAVLFFAAAVGWLGLVITAAATVVFAAAAGWEFRWREVLVLAAVCTVVSVLLFVTGLGLAFPLWPRL